MPKRVQKLMDAGVSTGELWLSYKEAQSQSNAEQDLLRESFQAVGKLQDATKRHFAKTPF